MKAQLIVADETHRAARGSIRSPQFRRMLKLAWPHRRFILWGLLASVAFALVNAVSVSGVIPVLKILLSDEGIHGWVDRVCASARLGAELDVWTRTGPPSAMTSAPPAVVVKAMSRVSPLRDAGVEPWQGIVSIDGEALPPEECLRRIADAPAGRSLRLGVASLAGADQPRVECRVTPRPLSSRWRAVRAAASRVPREEGREGRLVTLLGVLAALAVAVILANALRFIAEYLISLGTFRAMMDLRRALYGKVLRLPMSFFLHNVSDLVSRFVQDVQEIQRGMVVLFGRLLRDPLRAAAVFAVALVLNWRITLILLAVAPGASFLFWYVGRKIRRANRRLLRGYGTMIGALETTLHAIGVTKAYTAEHVERRRLWRIDRGVFRQQIRIAALEAFLKPMLEVVGIVAILGVAGWLGAQVVDAQMKPDEFLGLLFILGMMFEPLRSFGELYGRVQRAAAGAQRIFSVLDSPSEEELMEGPVELPPLGDSIEFRDVTFRYPGTTRAAVTGVSLRVRRGEAVALVGRNGSGKTTLMNLLLRFYDPQQGRICVDGRDIRQVTLRSLRKQIGLVPQEAVVFPLSMSENIAYGARGASESQVVAASRRAFADEFIRAMADGYATVSGERGMTLSGGQRQRLAIARAILRAAPILIFDEATSQVDAESEARIQQVLRELASARTTFIIAHRLSTIQFADRIVVMDEGRIVDTGTHGELLGRCPLYQVLCQTQLIQ